MPGVLHWPESSEFLSEEQGPASGQCAEAVKGKGQSLGPQDREAFLEDAAPELCLEGSCV